jgi:hypothetical protein
VAYLNPVNTAPMTEAHKTAIRSLEKAFALLRSVQTLEAQTTTVSSTCWRWHWRHCEPTNRAIDGALRTRPAADRLRQSTDAQRLPLPPLMS